MSRGRAVAVLRVLGEFNAAVGRAEAVLAWIPLAGGTTLAGYSPDDYIDNITRNADLCGAERAQRDPDRLIARMRRSDCAYDARYLPGQRTLLSVVVERA